MQFLRIHLILILLMLSSIPALSTENNGQITGNVITTQGKPIPNLHVILEETPLGDVSDSKGRFSINNIPPGTYTVSLSHIGFKTKILRDIEVTNTQPVRLFDVVIEEEIIFIDGVVVTATRSEKKITEVPQPVNLIPQVRIVERNAKTSAEALREEPGIFVQKTNHGGGSAIIRGMSSNQILLLVDGIRLNNSTYRLGNHQYLTTVDDQTIQQIEVVRGPTSVLYGSDAMGGTINTVTRRPSVRSGGSRFNYRLLSRYATADKEKTARAEFSVQHSRIGFHTGISFSEYGHLRRGENSSHPRLESSTDGLVQAPSGFSRYGVDTKLVMNMSDVQTLVLAYQNHRQKDVPRYDKYENNRYYRWIYEPQIRNLAYITYEHTVQNHFITSYRMSLSYHRQEEGRETQKSISSPLTKERDDVGTWGVTLQGHSIFDGHFLTYGLDAYFDHVSSQRSFLYPQTGDSEKDSRGRYPDGAKYHSAGFYLQDEVALSPRWTIIPGVRYSAFSTRFDLPSSNAESVQAQSHRQSFTALTGNVGVIYRWSKNVFFNANIGQAFRAPNLSDISKLGESKGSVYEIPNPDLVAEKMFSLDMGWKFDFDRFRFEFSSYYSRIHDLLASTDAMLDGSSTIQINDVEYKVKTKENMGKAFIRGLEGAITTRVFEKLFLNGNIAYTYGQNQTQNEPVGGIPPLFGRIGAEWRTSTYYVDLYMRFANEQTRLSSDDLDDPRIPEGGTPGWSTLNIRAGFPLFKTGKLHLAIENILDKNYREHGSGINGPGRNFVISFELRP